MRKHTIYCCFYPIMVMLLIMTLGCGTTKSIYKKVKPDKPYLIKKIMVFPPIDLSGLAAGKAAQTTQDFIEILKQSPQLSIHTPPDGWSVPTHIKTPKFGVAYYDPKIAQMARDRNMNVLLAAFLPPIEKTIRRDGIWPFRYDADVYKIAIVINAMNVANGCLYLTELSSNDVYFKPDEVSGMAQKEIFEKVWEKGMPDILEQQAELVTEKLIAEPWTGRILNNQKGLVMINAGKDSGVQPGQLFNVFSKGESIVCQTGKQLDLTGEKIGEIKAVSVMEEHTLAKPESGGPFSVGQSIRFKPE